MKFTYSKIMIFFVPKYIGTLTACDHVEFPTPEFQTLVPSSCFPHSSYQCEKLDGAHELWVRQRDLHRHPCLHSPISPIILAALHAQANAIPTVFLAAYDLFIEANILAGAELFPSLSSLVLLCSHPLHSILGFSTTLAELTPFCSSPQVPQLRNLWHISICLEL